MAAAAVDAEGGALAAQYRAVRAQTAALAAGLSEADCQAQSMPDASPVKWHLGHTTWFFETFVLERFEPAFRPHHPAFRVLFNSYYNGVGGQHPRAERGLITRPGLAEVLAWRSTVDERLMAVLAGPAAHDPGLVELLTLGLHHEQQHQELLLTDLLHLFGCNPLAPVWRPLPAAALRLSGTTAAHRWLPIEGGLVEVGHRGAGFAFDNEGPCHAVHLRPFALAQRPVGQGQWADFIADGGYADPRWWLAAGWDWVQAQRVTAPLHWRRAAPDAPWQVFTLHGLQPLAAQSPVAHISGYEAEAFAAWWGAQHPHDPPARLPTEAEWEHAASHPGLQDTLPHGHFADSGAVLPLPAPSAGAAGGPLQLFGDVWEWTASPYTPYPGFRPWAGAVGEYNAKFMVNQRVLRGGSCATPAGHVRASYRNFFPMDARWQFSGLRLARDLD